MNDFGSIFTPVTVKRSWYTLPPIELASTANQINYKAAYGDTIICVIISLTIQDFLVLVKQFPNNIFFNIGCVSIL